MRKYFLAIWPFMFLFTVWFIFAAPYFLQNKTIYPSTYQVNHFAPWSIYEKFWGPVKNGAMPDIVDQIYPWRYFTIESWRQSIVPLWNPYSFSGTPHLANYQSAVFSPFNLLFFIFNFIDAWNLLVLLQPLLAGIFMYLFVRSLRISKAGSVVSSLSFMFCGFLTTWMGYATLGYAILFLPLALFSIERYLETLKKQFLFLLAFTIPLSFFSGHFQISIYFLLVVLAYIVYKLVVTKNLPTTFYLLLYTLFGLLLCMPQIIPSMEFYLQSYRSAIFQKGEVIPWSYLPTLLAPDFFGNPVTRNDWFGHYAEWNSYIGIIPLMLALYAFVSKKRVQTLFLFILGILSLLLAFQSPLLDLVVNLHIPVLSTSAASRIIVVFSFLFSVLSAFGYDQLVLDLNNGRARRVLLWMCGFLILFLALWSVVFLKLFMPFEKIMVAKNNLILPTLIFGGSAILIALASFRKKLMPIIIFSLLLIVSFDMLRFTRKWQPVDPKDLVYPGVETITAFSKIEGHSRVLGKFGGETAIYYHLPSLEGYDALYIKRYGEFAASVSDGKLKELYRSVVAFPKDGLYTPSAINLLNVRYVVHKLADDHAVWTFPFWTYPSDQFKLIYKDEKYEFYENTKALPHAFLVDSFRVVSESQAILDTMFGKDFDLSREIVLEENPGLEPGIGEPVGKVDIEKYSANKVTLEIDAFRNGLLFLSDPYYEGWRAQVDGVDVSIYKADYAFRAIPVNQGRHTVVFNYAPWSFRLGVNLALLGFLGMGTSALLPKTSIRLKSSSFLRIQKGR